MDGASVLPAVAERHEEAFGILANRHRIEILRTLVERESGAGSRDAGTTSFSELHEAVSVRSTSRFAYHLDRLVGTFVTDVDGEYRPTYLGETVVRTTLAGSFEPAADVDPVAVDARCPLCGSRDLLAENSGDLFVLRCEGCDGTLLVDYLPTSETTDRTPAEAVESFGRRLRNQCEMVSDGTCPECYGKLETTVDRSGPNERPFYRFRSTCHQCLRVVHVPVVIGCLLHPGGIAFLWETGVAASEAPLWDLFEYAAPDACDLVVSSEAPFEAEVTLTRGGRSCRFRVREDFDLEHLGKAPSDDG